MTARLAVFGALVATLACIEPPQDPHRMQVSGLLASASFPDPHAVTYRSDAADEDPTAPPLAPGMATSRCLTRAAQAWAQATAGVEHHPEMDFTDFVLHWAGCPDATARVVVLRSSDEEPAQLIEEIRRLAENEELTHVGLGSARETPPFRWRHVALVTERRARLDPVPAQGVVSSTLPLGFTVDEGYIGVRLVVLAPGASPESFGVPFRDGRGHIDIPLRSTSGRQWVEIMATGSSGPEVLALFPIWVDTEPPRRWSGALRDPASNVLSGTDAERRLSDLVNHARTNHGLQALPLRPELSTVARAHSRDMSLAGDVAHYKTGTGWISDRLRRAGVFFRFASENVAMAPSVDEAHEALLTSPAHRGAILNPDVRAFGVGVITKTADDGERMFFVTQIFVTP
jgi:hypothetical protein